MPAAAGVQTIAFHPRHRDAVLDGSKTVTVRWREGIVPGPALLRLGDDEHVGGIVRSVTHVPIADLTPQAVHESAGADMAEYVRLLRTRYYPGMPDDAVLDVVTFVIDASRPEGRAPAAAPTHERRLGRAHPSARQDGVRMGVWDVGPFDNDTAADWALGLEALDAAGRAEAVRAALDDAAASAMHDLDGTGDVAIAAAAWVLHVGTDALLEGGPSLEPPTLDAPMRDALVAAMRPVLDPDSAWVDLQREAGDEALDAAAAIAARLDLADPRIARPADDDAAPEEHWAEIVPVVDAHAGWQGDGLRFRVRRFAPDDADPSGWRVVAVEDVLDGEVTDALMHAEDTMAPGDWVAVSLVTSDGDVVTSEVWLVGRDPREPIVTDADQMRVRRMGMRADYSVQMQEAATDLVERD